MNADPEILRRGHTGVVVAQCAGDILRDYRDQLGPVDHKGAVDLVTEADRTSQAYIEQALREAFPLDGFIAEEGDLFVEGSSGFVWVVDPLDGTTNYVHGYAPYCVSVGLLHGGRPVFGAVFSVASNEMFAAVRGRGARLNGKVLCVSGTKRVADSLLATGFPYNRREIADELLVHVKRALMSAHGFRRSGAASADLCAVARGALDGFWELGLKPWDLAAGALIIEEAGGRVTNYQGGPHDLFEGRTVASNGVIHGELLSILFGE